MNEHDFDAQLQQKIQQLPESIQPKRDLWPGIEASLVERELAQREQAAANTAALNDNKAANDAGFWKPLAMAAAVACISLMGWLGYHNSPSTSPELPLVQVLSQQHEQQKQALLVSFSGRNASTDNWQEQLQELDAAAAAIKQALQQDPDNLALLKMLQQTYQQQIQLIEKVHTPGWQAI